MTKKLLATLTIAGLSLVAGATVANAAPQDQPWGPGADGLVHFDDGTCYQPMSNPPAHVSCGSTRATTPYVSGERFADDPVSTAPPDTIVPEAANEPAVPRTRSVKATHVAPIARPEAIPMRWEFQHGA